MSQAHTGKKYRGFGGGGVFNASAVLKELGLRFEAAAWKGQSELLTIYTPPLNCIH